MPVSGINMTYNNTGTIGSQDGDIQIKLQGGPPADRGLCPHAARGAAAPFPGHDVLVPAGRHHQPDPELRRARADRPADPRPQSGRRISPTPRTLLRRLRHVPGLADARIQQSLSSPGFNVDVDRTRAQYVGLTERDVTNSMVVNLAGSSQVAPTYWLNPDNGVSYPIVMQTPQYQIDSLTALKNLPITAAGAPSQTLGGDRRRHAAWPGSAVVSQYNIQPMVQIYATTQGRDLGAVAADVQKVVDETANDVPKGAQVVLLGQVRTMNSALSPACCSACSARSC